MNKETIGTTLAGAVIGSALAGIPGLIVGAAALCLSTASNPSKGSGRGSWPPAPYDIPRTSSSERRR